MIVEYLRTNPDLSLEVEVEKFLFTNKGVVAFTSKFAGTYWKNKAGYDELEEAIRATNYLGDQAPVFVAKAHANGQISIGVDPELTGKYTWAQASDNTYERSSASKSKKEGGTSNPFLSKEQESLLLAGKARKEKAIAAKEQKAKDSL